MSETINGIQFRDAVISAAENITAHRKDVDELNVFPVPDGDTGTNMAMTINNASRELSMSTETELSSVAKKTSMALLRGARGNSGVILSLLFRGIAKGFKGLETADGAQLAAALKSGVDSAYKAVMKPTEGTVLTVARVSAEKAAAFSAAEKDASKVLECAYEASKVALANTPEQLPVLKKAGVVDAGGQGYVYILEGMLSVIRDGKMIKGENVETKKSEPDYLYTAEFVIARGKSENDPIKLQAYLETAGRPSVTVSSQSVLVKIETNDPGLVIQESIKYGVVKDVRLTYNGVQPTVSEAAPEASDGEKIQSVAPEKPFGFVAVAAGKGMSELFTDLGADTVVEGGQTMNPSTDDILKAIEKTPAETVFVFPNNKNIIMAAEQAIPLASRRVCVLPTLSVPMGISAMIEFDEEASVEDNLITMGKAAERTTTGSVTFAARDSDFDGKEIKKGEILALKNGKISFVDDDLVHAVGKLTKTIVTKDTASVTLFYGADVDEETLNLAVAACEAKAGGVEVTVIDGGQPIYYFIIAADKQAKD